MILTLVRLGIFWVFYGIGYAIGQKVFKPEAGNPLVDALIEKAVKK